MVAAERETVFTYNMEEKLVRIYSTISKDQRKLAKKGIEPYEGSETKGFFYRIPLDSFRWGLKRASKPGVFKGKRFKRGDTTDKRK